MSKHQDLMMLSGAAGLLLVLLFVSVTATDISGTPLLVLATCTAAAIGCGWRQFPLLAPAWATMATLILWILGASVDWLVLGPFIAAVAVVSVIRARRRRSV